MYNTFRELDEFIDTMFVSITPTDLNPTSLNRKNKGFEIRENNYKIIPGGFEVFDSYISILGDITQSLSDQIAPILEQNWGYSATNPGIAPSDFIKPGGHTEDGHRQS